MLPEHNACTRSFRAGEINGFNNSCLLRPLVVQESFTTIKSICRPVDIVEVAVQFWFCI